MNKVVIEKENGKTMLFINDVLIENCEIAHLSFNSNEIKAKVEISVDKVEIEKEVDKTN